MGRGLMQTNKEYTDPNDIPEELLEPATSIKEVYEDPNDIPDYLLESNGINAKGASWGEVLTQSLKNIPESGKKYYKAAYEAIRHPIETGKGLASIAKGLVKTAALRQMAYGLGYDDNVLDLEKDPETKIVKRLEEQYGTEEGLKEYIANDPVGVFSDLISILIPATKGTTIGKIATKLEPTTAALKIASYPFKLVKESIPIEMYQKAVQFSTKLPQDDLNKVTKTAIDIENQIMPNRKGIAKLKSSMDVINKEISSKIIASTLSGEEIMTSKLWNGLRTYKEELLRLTDEPIPVDAAWNVMKKNIKKALSKGTKRTPEEIQIMKQDIYKELESFYEQTKKSPAKIKLRKAVAQNARKLIEDIVPEVKELNQKDKALIELWDALETRANAISIKDLITYGQSMKMGALSGAGYLVGGEKGAVIGGGIGILLAIYSHPQVRSKLAIVLEELRTKGININPKISQALLAEYESGKLTNEDQND